jgi:hypothetical protein
LPKRILLHLVAAKASSHLYKQVEPMIMDERESHKIFITLIHVYNYVTKVYTPASSHPGVRVNSTL